MHERAAAHRRERGPEFDTIEEPVHLTNRLTSLRYDAIVIDCLTLWLSNLMLSTPPLDIEHETTTLLNTAAAANSTIILITNEVGCGIVPENDLARRFRDAAGYLNQRAAAAAQEAYFLAFGCPIRLK
jgi:adenosylcobinamide kinase/adenosylcobinamide-phosphate guanylyltransferase